MQKTDFNTNSKDLLNNLKIDDANSKIKYQVKCEVKYADWLKAIHAETPEIKKRLWREHGSGITYQPLYCEENSRAGQANGIKESTSKSPSHRGLIAIELDSRFADGSDEGALAKSTEVYIRNLLQMGAEVVLSRKSMGAIKMWHSSQTGEVQVSRKKSFNLAMYAEMGASISHQLFIFSEFLEKCSKEPQLLEEPLLLEVAIGSETYLEMAKFRAIRKMIYAKNFEKEFLILARSAKHSLSNVDCWVNILRGTSVAFAALVGGADMVLVQAFEDRESPDKSDNSKELALRLAINTPLILRTEGGLLQSEDAGKGSWALESMTCDLITQVDELKRQFQSESKKSESKTSENISSESISLDVWLASQIKLQVDKKKENLRKRKDIMIGVNDFVNMNEVCSDRGQRNTEVKSEVKSESSNFLNAFDLTLNLPFVRWAEEFELLRYASQKYFDANKKHPYIEIIGLGPTSQYLPRLTWIQNLLDVAGIRSKSVIFCGDESIGGEEKHGVLEGVGYWNQSQSVAGIFCANDKEYDWILKGDNLSGNTFRKGLFLAGNPGSNKASWQKLGVGDFIYLGVDVIEISKHILNRLGVTV